jgi:hypothetical protein
MSIVISLIALIISALTCIIHFNNYKNTQYERMTNLRSNLLSRLLNMKQRIDTYLITLASVRLLLRTVDESDDKYLSIEKMPKIIDSSKELQNSLFDIINKIKNIVIKKINIDKTIIMLHEIEPQIIDIEASFDDLEKQTSDLIDKIKAREKSTKIQ